MPLRYAHFNNNDEMKAKHDPNYDPLFKVRPLLDSLREQLKKVEQGERQCIDEQMIPFKGRSSLKQYLKKTKKMGVQSLHKVRNFWYDVRF